jgi:hypothetical protein
VGFSVDFDGINEFYMFVGLVFGLRTAGQVLGRLLKPVIMAAWASGAHLLIYIDDGHGLSKLRNKRRQTMLWCRAFLC